MCRKLIFLISLVLVLALVGANVTFGTVIEIPVATENDDAEEDVGGGSDFDIDLDSSDLEFSYDNDSSEPLDEQVVGIRFVDVQIPKGENIRSAVVRFDADDVDDAEHVGDAYVIIEGELSPNPGTFEETANNITARPRTAETRDKRPPRIQALIRRLVGRDLLGPADVVVSIIGFGFSQ